MLLPNIIHSLLILVLVVAFVLVRRHNTGKKDYGPVIIVVCGIMVYIAVVGYGPLCSLNPVETKSVQIPITSIVKTNWTTFVFYSDGVSFVKFNDAMAYNREIAKLIREDNYNSWGCTVGEPRYKVEYK